MIVRNNCSVIITNILVECMLILLLVPPIYSQSEGSQVGLQITVNAVYDDSPASLRLLRKLADLLPARRVSMQSTDTISSLVVREFGFGISDRKRSYLLIESEILRLNGWTKPEDARPGAVLIPSMPRIAWGRHNPVRHANLVPKISSLLASRLEVASSGLSYYTSSPLQLEQDRPYSPRSVVELNIPLRDAIAISDDADLGPLTYLINKPVTIEIAGYWGDELDPPEILTQEERNAVLQTISRSNRQVILFVLDTGWPTATDYGNSRRNLRLILDTIWRSILRTQPPIRPKDKDFAAPTHNHCIRIQAALHELTSLGSQFVHVIYVPLIREQDSNILLSELIQVSYLAEMSKANTSHDVTPTQKEIKHALGIAKDIVDRLPDRWPQDQVQVKTDKAVIDALLRIGHLYASTKRSVFFLNESWTTPHDKYSVTYPSPLAGLVVAATGNAAENVNTTLRDFAQRSVLNRDTVAVMNMDRNGQRQCSSSFVDDRDIDDALAVGFDGRIGADANDCGMSGTSFAAPRVAWLLAVAETARPPVAEFQRWPLEFYRSLKRTQRGGPGPTNLWFDIQKFLHVE
jgi:hypothetical protein